MLTDTHCHLDLRKFDADREVVIQRALDAGVTRILIPGLDAESSQRAVELAEKHPPLYAAVGFHPTDITKLNDHAYESIRRLAEKSRVVAIGEIGLDYYWVTGQEEREAQRTGLQLQLAMALEVNKPVVIHLREEHDAEDGACAADLIRILQEWIAVQKHHPPAERSAQAIRSKRLAEGPGVLHSFSGSLELARRALALGFYIGVTGPVTYKNAEKRRRVIASLPLERLLIETDAPFLAPDPHRGKRNEPAFVVHIADKIAEIQSRTPQEVAAVTTTNAARLFAWGDIG